MISNQTISSFLLGIGVGLLTSALYNRAVSKSINVKKVQISSLDDLEQSFRITPAMLRDLVKHFVVQLKHGLKLPNQTMLALPSFVTRLPTGNEKGSYLALDLGGTNLRICEVTLEGHGKFRMRQKKYLLTDELKSKGSASDLFDFIAKAISEFLVENEISEGRIGTKQLKLGFTFSFPVDQTALKVGTLMHWNKGFEIDGVVDHDVVSLLNTALIKNKLNINVVAIVNDTVGTLMAHAYKDPETYIGVIIGTGTNAAYVEKIDDIPKWKTHYSNAPVPSGKMVVNIEWGAFDNEKLVLPVTKYDQLLDRSSENANGQLFEKMISGLYLGDIARLVLLDLNHNGELFHGRSCPKLTEPQSFPTSFMSRIERDHSQDLSDTRSILEDILFIPGTTLRDRQIIKRVCEFIGIRAARLSAAAIAGVLSKADKWSGCTVAIDGSVFEHYPHFGNRMKDALREIGGVNSENVVIELARDGSGVGAALIACVMGEEN